MNKGDEKKSVTATHLLGKTTEDKKKILTFANSIFSVQQPE